MVWIHTLVTRKSKEFARTFPLPITEYTILARDPGLEHLLRINVVQSVNSRFMHSLNIDRQYTPSHSQWVSNVLLHLSWANQTPH